MTNVTRQEADLAVSASLESPADRNALALAVRKSLEWFEQENPGRAVEVRVPPFKAVQILGGTTHRRGTPPAVVEMTPEIWLQLFTKNLTWEQAVANGSIIASGERSDLSGILVRI
jgi:hypothetical protein